VSGSAGVVGNLLGGAKAGGKDVCDVSSNSSHTFKDKENKDVVYNF